MANRRGGRPGGERVIQPTDIDPAGSARGVDDHVATPYPRGIGHQPTAGLDAGADPEHLASSSQGARVEQVPDPDRPPPDGPDGRRG